MLPQRERLRPIRMLEKEPANRLQDASDLLEAMANLEVDIDLQAASGDTPVARSRTSFPPSEQQLVSVLLSSVPALVGACDSDTGEASSSDTEPVKDLERALSVFGADVQILADGSVVAMLTQRSHMAATDLAAQAARCALALVQCFPTSLSTLTTGRAMLDGRLPIGEVVERSVLMRELIMRPEHAAAQASGEVIYLDDVTAGLLDARFETRRLRAGVVALRGERTSIDETRSLLGRPTQTVGRDRELAVLDLLYSECRDDSNARVVLITAPAGMGKSRLRHEFVRRLESRHEPVRLLMGRGDPLTMASPYGLLAQAVRQLCGIAAGDDALLQRKKLWQYVHSRMPAAEVKRVGEFVGELCGISTSDEDSEALLSARQDLRLMSLEIFRAFGDLLAAECRVSPVLLVLEDLHWSDTPSVRLVDAALRDLNESRLMVLGLARPEIEKVFPRLWADRRCQDLRLESLNRKACERLVLRALNQQAPTAVVNRIIEQSAGNPLFLEELIRAVAEGKGDEMPETVLAMLQSRVMRLEPGARRVLRVASIFGQTFWRGGLIALLRAEPGSLDVELWLQRLVELEILELQRESRFPQEVQYRFRHGLFRDAAYSLLTAEHRRLGHRMAAEYLDHIGETDFFVLVEHLERAEPPREPLGPQAD